MPYLVYFGTLLADFEILKPNLRTLVVDFQPHLINLHLSPSSYYIYHTKGEYLNTPSGQERTLNYYNKDFKGRSSAL